MSEKSAFTRKWKGRIQSSINEGLPRKISAQVSQQIQDKLNSQLARQFISDAKVKTTAQTEKLKQSADELKNTFQTAVHVASTAAKQTVKQNVDQVLLGLEHRGINLKQPQDAAQAIALKVLARAEEIRLQIAKNPMTPSWLKDLSLTPEALWEKKKTQPATMETTETTHESSEAKVAAESAAGTAPATATMAMEAQVTPAASVSSAAAQVTESTEPDERRQSVGVESEETPVVTKTPKSKTGKKAVASPTSSRTQD